MNFLRIKNFFAALRGVNTTKYKVEVLEDQNKFLLSEIAALNKQLRYRAIENEDITDLIPQHLLSDHSMSQTKDSFDFQWDKFNTGAYMADNKKFMSEVKDWVTSFTSLPESWFDGKKVLDLGCGAGRYSHAMLSMGAVVTSADQSRAGLEQTKALCSSFGEKHTVRQENILTWRDKGDFDLVYCYGVTHHTGNTYMAIINAARKVHIKGGKLFLMIYGMPCEHKDFTGENSYRELRNELRNFSFSQKKEYLLKKFSPESAHGWFDQASPQINDLLTYEEIEEFLTALGFENIKRTVTKHRHHHIIADRK